MPAEWVAIASIVAVAAVAQSVSGFGLALLAIPLLSLVADAKTAVVASSVISVVLSTLVGVLHRRHIEPRRVGITAAAAALGMPLGLWFFTRADDRSLTIAIASMVLLFTALIWRGIRLPSGRHVDAAAGVVSGALSTSVGTSGPPIVLAFHADGMSPPAFRASIAGVFWLMGVISLAGFAAAGELTRSAAEVALAGLPGLAIGWLVGERVFTRIDHARFRVVVLWMLTAGAIVSLVGVART